MISVNSVTRCFGTVRAVDGVSFALAKDQIVGFFGPNGAGKSTLLRMLSTYLSPTSGRLEVDGLDVVRRPLEVRSRIGYLPGETPLYHAMRADRFLDFIARAHGLSGARRRDRMAWVVESCGLKEALTKRIKECSTGYRKRIGLVAALIHDPAVLLLDEPT